MSGCALSPSPPPSSADTDVRPTDESNVALDGPPSDEPTPEALAREAERALDMFLRDQKVLFLQGEFEFELGVVDSMETRSNARFGPVVVPEFRFHSTTASLLTRYALTDDLEINLFVPVVTSERDYDFLFLSPVPGLEDDTVSGLGDISAGLRYQLLRERGAVPDLALALDYKGDTAADGVGTDDDSVSVKSTLVSTIDPVVFFAEIGYDYTFESDDVDRGDEFFAQLGTGFSVNDRVSFNAQYGVRLVGTTTLDGVELKGSELVIANLQFGLTTQLTRNVFLEPFLSVGLTEDATDVSVGLGVPF